jgi:predicted heme/steroid binding protein
MRTKITLAAIGVFFLGGIAIFATNRNASQSSPTPFTNGTSAGSESINPNAGGTGAATGTSAGNGKTYTLAEVQKHSTQSSCWTTINGKVYDVTSWISQHPGGAQAILSLCGKDGSSAFNAQHGGQRRPANELAGFLIGSLAGATTSAGGASSGTSAQTPVTSSNDDGDE